jgi:ankyrin repeat protein
MEEFELHKATLESDYDKVRELIDLKVNLDELDNHGHTALHWAVFRGDIDLIKILLDGGANPNILSDDGVTPKWRARDFGLSDVEELLSNYGGKILTNEDFDRISFTVFNNAIGLDLPEEDNDNKKDEDNNNIT